MNSLRSRRRFLQLLTLGSGAGVLAACAPSAPLAVPPTSAPVAKPAPTSPPPPVAPTLAPTAAPTVAAAVAQPTVAVAPTAAAKTSALPTYVALASKPKADYPSKGELYEDGYITYP